ncbi:MAG: SRPBCC domain-containing protein [Acidimicrobiales bacterium]
MIDPLRLAFEVECSAEHAFAVWTAKTSRWWPAGHSVSGEAGLEVVFEPRVDGRIFERTPGGEEFEWGEITDWDPPRQLSYLWHLRRDRADATDVIIRFADLGQATRVEIEHRGWERLGADGPRWREANQGGWSGLVPHFVSACATPEILAG